MVLSVDCMADKTDLISLVLCKILQRLLLMSKYVNHLLINTACRSLFKLFDNNSNMLFSHASHDINS